MRYTGSTTNALEHPEKGDRLMAMGFVSIVGAGPGDPALLTRKALACLRRADLVLYDALVDRRVLDLARRARRFFVGKRAGRHQVAQSTIHSVMVRAARRGLRVVRLKGGDPFVFGRGGEEALALGAAGVPFEIVPGVTSAVAAPSAAGIPVTHRGISSAFLVVSGHDEILFDTIVAGLTPNALTLVILMGAARRAALATRLIERGWRMTTGAAAIMGAHTEAQHVWKGTLADLAAGPLLRSDEAVTIVIGEVAKLDCISAQRSREGCRRALAR